MKYSKSAIGLLTAQYRSVLKKCWLINVGLFALGAAVATPANAEYTPVESKVTVAAGQTETLNGNSFTNLINSNGGAVNNAGTTTIKDSLFSGNSAKGNNHQYGGAIYNSSKLSISGTEFSNNSAVYDSISENQYSMLGGAIYNTGSGMLTIDDSSFIGNSVNSGKPRGAAIWNTANAVITNSIFKQNETINSKGGTDMMGSAIYHTTGTMTLDGNTFGGDNATDGNIGASAFVANTGTVHFKDNTFKNNAGGAVNLQGTAVADFSGTHVFSGTNGSGNETAALYLSSYENPTATFKSGGTNTFSNNNATVGAALRMYKYGDFTGSSVTFEEGTTNTFSNNTATTNGGAVYNQEQTLTLNGTFSNNHAGENGGAIYNTANGTINFNGNATFSENTDSTGANDIYNAGTINFGGTADLAGGIDGAAGTVNVSGDVKVANALKNQTVTATAGELALDKVVDLTGSTVAMNSGSTLNMIDDTINDYSANVTLNSGAKFKADFNATAGDKFAAADDAILTLTSVNMLDGFDVGQTKEYTVASGASIMTNAKAYTGGYKYTAAGNSSFSGKVSITNEGDSLINDAVEDTEAGTKTNITYDMATDETYFAATGDNAKIQNSNFVTEGNNKTLSAASGATGIEIENSDVTFKDMTFENFDTDYALKNNAGSTLRIYNAHFDSSNAVAVDNAGVMYSDPTIYEAKVINSGTATFEDDSFENISSTAITNSSVVNLKATNEDVKFINNGKDVEQNNGQLNLFASNGKKVIFNAGITGTGTSSVNLMSGTSVFNANVTGNDLSINNGANLVLGDNVSIDGLTLTNDTNNGTIDLRNKRIDTLGSTTLGSNLNVLMDLDLNADKSDTLGTITAGGYGLNLNAVELLKLGSDHEEIQIATAGTNVALSSDTLNTLKTYYTNVSYDTGTGILTLDGKASPVTDLIGSWGTGNYIKAYNVADSANTSVGANLTILDAQVKTNADDIAANKTDIATNTAAIATKQDATVSYSSTNYLDSQTTLTGADVALDTQIKANADAITATDAKFTSGTVDAKFKSLNINDAVAISSGGNISTSGTLSVAGGKASIDANGVVKGSEFANSSNTFSVGSDGAATVASLKFGTGTAMDGIDTTATSGNTTKLITSDAVYQGLSAKLTGAEAADYAVSGKRGAELAANIATYVTANGDKFADVQNTTNVITDLFNDKALYIQETTGMDQAHSVAYNYNQSTQDLLHGATSMLNADEKLAAAVGSKQAQLVNDKDPAENISNVVATTIRASDAASDTTLVTEKAISTALETKVNNAGNFTETTDSALIKDKTVVAAIRDTATAVETNTAKNTVQDTALTNLYAAVNGGTYNTTTGEVTGATALSTNFTATNLTAAANELLGDITVTDDGNYIKANKTAAQNLGILDSQVKTNADDIAATAALVGTTSAPKTGTGILAGKTITGTAGTDNLNMVDAIAYVAANAAGLNVDNVYTGKNTFGATEGSQVIITNGGSMSVDKNLTIGKANAISSASNGDLDMGGNTLSNVRGLTLTDGSGHTHDATISATANGVLIDKSLEISGSIKATGIDTSTANTVNLGGTGFTTAVTGNMTVSGDTTMTGKLTVNGDTTLAKTNVTGDLTVTGNTSLANTSVAGTLDVTGKSTFGSATGSRIELDGGALTVKDSTQAVVATIDNSGNADFKGTLDVDGLASLDGGINVNDKFAVDTNGKVTLSDGTNTATIEATQIKDSDGNNINNVMKVDGTGLYTGYVASESGFTVAQKNAVTGLYEETFTVNEDGEITGVGLTTDKTNGVDLGVAGTTTDIIGSAINIGGAATTTANLLAGTNGVNVSATGTDITGNFSVATDKFTVDSTTGNTAVAGTMDIEGDTKIGNKFSVTATDGSMSAAGGKFSVNHNGAITAADGAFHVWRTGGISAANGNFTVDKDGNVTAQGNLGVQGTSWLKDTNVDGALSVTGESWLKNTHVDGALAVTGDASVAKNFTVAGQSYLHNTSVDGDLAVSGTTKTGALTFNGSSYVAAMDQGDAAITNGVVDDQAKRTMATVATVAKTIGKLDDKNAHGVTDVSDVASAISSLSQNVETATGGTFAGAVWTGAVDADKDVDYTYSPAATATATAGYHDIMSAVSQVASNVGAATTVAFNNVTDDNTVNANIDALNRKVGNMNNIGYGYKNLSNGTTTQPDTVVEALRNIDASMGTIHGLAAKLEKAGTYQGNLAEGTTVEQHLTALDSAIGNRANFNKMHYTQGSKSVVDAIGKLDTKLNSVDHDVRTLRHHFQSGMASAAALSALVPNARAHGNTQLSVGTGMYHGHGAMAVGGFHWFTDNILFNTGIAWDDNEATYRMGVTYSW